MRIRSRPGMPFDFEGVSDAALDAGRKRRRPQRRHRQLLRAKTRASQHRPRASGAQRLRAAAAQRRRRRRHQIARRSSSRETKRGLLVTRLWYVRTVDRKRAIVTGMTRDGTFLIENGKIVRRRAQPAIQRQHPRRAAACEFSHEQVGAPAATTTRSSRRPRRSPASPSRPSPSSKSHVILSGAPCHPERSAMSS